MLLVCEDSGETEIVNDVLEEDDDLPILGAASCFMRINLNRIIEYFEASFEVILDLLVGHFSSFAGTLSIRGEFQLLTEGESVFHLKSKCLSSSGRWPTKRYQD